MTNYLTDSEIQMVATGFAPASPGVIPVSARHFVIRSTIQVDGVCPFCGHWHTVAMRNGIPSCRLVGYSQPTSFRTTGGAQ